MSYLYMRERAKEMTKSELQGNYWSQSNTVCELYRLEVPLQESLEMRHAHQARS
jgi:hypothetical protein